MTSVAQYNPRTLIADLGEPGNLRLKADEIAGISESIVIIGDPGLGKTRLTESLEHKYGWRRVPAGTFFRADDPRIFPANSDPPLIIDGLDEIVVPGGSPVDEVLRRWSRLGYPRLVLSCRAPDWEGSAAS